MHTRLTRHPRKMDVEQAFKVVGACGKYQAFLFSTIVMTSVYAAWQMLFMNFAGAMPELKTSPRGKMVATDMKTIVNEWNLIGDRSHIVDIISSVFMGGVLLGNVIIGQLSDRYGRKPVYFKGLILLIFTSFALSWSNDWRVFAVLRFFVGFFQGGVVLVSFVLAQELLGSSVWVLTGNILQALFSVGIIILAGMASIFTNWRHLSIVSSVPGLLLCLNYWIMPESPRWLYSQGKVAAAEETMRYLARKNGLSSATVSSIILEQKKSEKKSSKRHYSFKDLFSVKQLTTRTLVMAFAWFVLSFSYYGLTMNAKDLAGNLYISVALSGLVELPGCVICASLLNRPWAGRRRSLIGFLTCAGFFCLAVLFLHNPAEKSIAKTAMALIGKLAISAAFSLVYIYASELFPTVLRNVGMGSSSMCARIGGILAPFAHSLEAYGAAIPYVSYGVASMVAARLIFYLPETLNKPIPDNIEDIQDDHTTDTKHQVKGQANLAYAANSEDKHELLMDGNSSDNA